MKPQAVTINLPKVKVTINDILVAELKSTTIQARGVKDIKNSILDLENQFYMDVSNYLKNPLEPASAKLIVRAELEGKEIVKYEVTTRATSSTKDFSLMSSNSARRVMKIILQALQAYPIEIILANGSTLTSSVRYLLDDNIKIRIMLTQKGLELADKGQVSISYGSNEHVVLYGVSQGTWQHRTASLITLTYLSLVEDKVPAAGNVQSTGRYVLTEEGERVLGELDQIDPSTCPELVPYFASRLLRVSYNNTSEFDYFFITDGGFCEPTKDQVPYYKKVTDKGRKWLEEHSSELLKKWTLKRGTQDKVKALIPYLSLRQLPQFLASEYATIRKLAQKRLEELQTINDK